MKKARLNETMPAVWATANSGSFSVQVLQPLCQSLISAVAVGVAVGMATYGFIDKTAALPVGAVAGLVAFCASWWLLLDDTRSLLRVSQTSFQPEPLQTDFETPKPQERGTAPRPTERLILVNGRPQSAVESSQANERKSRFESFVRQAALDTSQRHLEQSFSRDEIREYRDVLIRLKLAKQRSRDPRRGWTLTAPIEEILSRLE